MVETNVTMRGLGLEYFRPQDEVSVSLMNMILKLGAAASLSLSLQIAMTARVAPQICFSELCLSEVPRIFLHFDTNSLYSEN